MDADEEMAIAVHDELVAENKRLRAALEAVDSEVLLTGHLKQLVDEALRT